MTARGLRPLLLVLREQGRECLLAAIDIDDPTGELDLEVVALRRELDRAPVLGDGLVVLLHGLERLAPARDDLHALARIAAEQLLRGRVAIERDLLLAGGEHRIAALDPQLGVLRVEVEELLEVDVRAVDVARREREIREGAERRLLHVLRGRVRECLVVRGARVDGLVRRLLDLADEEPRRRVGGVHHRRAGEQLERARVIARLLVQPAQHDERRPVRGLRVDGLLVLGLQQIDGAIPPVHLEELRERAGVVRVLREQRLVARDDGLIERVPLHAPVAGLGAGHVGGDRGRGGRQRAREENRKAPHPARMIA